MLTLWDLIEPIRKRLRAEKVAPPPLRDQHEAGRPEAQRHRGISQVAASVTSAEQRDSAKGKARSRQRTRSEVSDQSPQGSRRVARASPTREGSPPTMQAKYDTVVRMHLEQYEIRVRKWRTSMSGIAWYVTYRDGRVQRLIESPRPKGPMSIAVFLHEIGHHAIGFDVYKPRCLEEYHAWRWAIEAMERHDLNITDAVRHRMHMSLWYAVQKAKRRGIKQVPPELAPFLEKPPRRARRSASPRTVRGLGHPKR